MKTKSWFKSLVSIFFVMIAVSSLAGAEPAGEYLKYQEPQPSGSSVMSSLAYIISLLVTFAVIIGLAYFTSRFLGYKMGRLSASGGAKVLSTLPLGPNRGVFVVEIAGRFLVLGVTEHAISLLQEITSEDEIQKLQAQYPVEQREQFDNIFKKHLVSLHNMSKRFPAAFGVDDQREQGMDRRKR